MKTLLMTLLVLMPSLGMAGALFPDQPVDMQPGYGKDGAGTHFAVPEGLPGNDCVINPVSMTWGVRNEIETYEVEVTKVVPGTVFSIPAKVLFDFDGDVVRDEAYEGLYAFLSTLIEEGVLEMTIIGHTDSKGSDEYNQDLGQRRAEAVLNFFEPRGVGVVLWAESRGESEPLVPNTNEDGTDNPENRQQNRRVDLRIDKSMVEVTEVEIVEEPTIVFFHRNPQVFHRLASNNTVLCESRYGVGSGAHLGFGIYNR